MAIKTWDAFQPLVLSDLPGCPWLSIKEALIAASIDFFDRTKAWRTEPAVTFNTVIGQADYAPSLPGSISRITSLKVVGGDYLEKCRRGLNNPGEYTENGTPIEYLKKNATTITIFPTPSAVITLALDCSITPNRDTATGIEDDLYQDYAEIIASGAIERLAAKPIKKPWSNPELAAYHKQLFEQGISQSIYADMDGVTPRARPRMF